MRKYHPAPGRKRIGTEDRTRAEEKDRERDLRAAASMRIYPQSHDDYECMDAGIHSGEIDEWELRDDEW